MANQDAANNGVSSVRDDLVRTAVKFLQNPKVSRSPLKQQQEFLQRKGLTEEEIKKACELSAAATAAEQDGALPRKQNEFTAVTIPYGQGPPFPYHQMQPWQPTRLQRLKEVLNSAALFGAALYCVYWFYKKFIRPFLFGRKEKKTVEESVTDLDKTIKSSMKEMQDSIAKVEADVGKLSQNQSVDPSIPHLVQELKQDLASLKGLLLSRKQFPSVPASIPPWQLAASNPNQEKTTEREDDAGSGSSTNNSDSSLEMIREDPHKELN